MEHQPVFGANGSFHQQLAVLVEQHEALLARRNGVNEDGILRPSIVWNRFQSTKQA